MAWEDIAAYTVGELTKAKAEIDEVIGAIETKLAAHKHRNGKLTDEEHYSVLFINTLLALRSAEFSVALAAETDIAAVKALIEGSAFGMTQADATTEAVVKAKVEAVIAALELDGVTAKVEKVSYTAAIAGDAGDPDGTDGSYKFKVALSKDDRSGTTKELTMTITATPNA